MRNQDKLLQNQNILNNQIHFYNKACKETVE